MASSSPLVIAITMKVWLMNLRSGSPKEMFDKPLDLFINMPFGKRKRVYTWMELWTEMVLIGFVPASNPAEFVGFESPIATYPLLVIY